MGRVIIVGANQGGALLAELLGRAGHDVTVYDKADEGRVAFDWHDDMHPSTYSAVGIPPLDAQYSFPKADWSFVSPGKSITRIHQDADRVDLSTERRALAQYLQGRAKPYASFCFGTEVARAVVDGNAVVGVELGDGSTQYADFVADCSGVNSTLRASLPDSFHIQQRANPQDVFVAYRAFYNRAAGVADPEYTNKAYLKHLGEAGISWCIWDQPSDTVNVLVGRISEMKDETFDRAMRYLREDNPIIGDEIVRGGYRAIIPVRRPISRFVAHGYALLGDSAFMTIPMLGSGMATSMRAAKMLADVISTGGEEPFSIQNLYRYQVQYMREIGAEHSGVDLMKTWLLTANSSDIAYLFDHRILNEEDLKLSCVGGIVKLTPRSLIEKATRGFAKLPLLLRLAGLLRRIDKQIAIANAIPEVYDERALQDWQRRYSMAFGCEY